MIIIAVDPGVRACGWARFEKPCGVVRLVDCGLFDVHKDHKDMVAFLLMAEGLQTKRADFHIVERPQIYCEAKQKGRQEDNARLLILCGVLCGIRGHGELVLPHDWKGSVPKPKRLSDIDSYIIHRRNVRTWGRGYLPKDVDQGKLHNVADAVGLGTWWIRQKLTRR